MYISVFIIIQIFRNCFNSIISFEKLNSKGFKGVIVSLREYFIYNNMLLTFCWQLCLTHLGEMRVYLARALIHFTFLCIYFITHLLYTLFCNIGCCSVRIATHILYIDLICCVAL